MTIKPPTQRELDRWYKLKDHPVQMELLTAVARGIRFPVVPAGRRSGKTERLKRFVAKQAMEHPNEKYVLAAPTSPQAKKIFWGDMKLLTFASLQRKRANETEAIITLNNNTEIHIVGLDQPARFEGIPWTGGGIDEIADIKEGALGAHILPALATVHPLRPEYRPWCWFIGVPDGLNFYYDLAMAAKNGTAGPEWGYFHWKSNEILPPDVIAGLKRIMSAHQFRQETEATFEGATGRIYSDYDGDINHTSESIAPHEQLLWMHDFNYTPMSSAVGVRRDDHLMLLDEIVLESAVARQSAVEFVEKFEAHENKHVLIYGDPAGRAGEKHGHESDYTDMEQVLRQSGWTYTRKVRPAAPAIKDRQNAVRAKILAADGTVTLWVNPAKAKYCDKGLATVQLKKGSTFQEDQDNQYQHITTAIGYCVDMIWPSKPNYDLVNV